MKFHGTAEDPTSLAFTERELMTPLPDEDAEHLARQVEHRTLVLYGYAGADADLADLLELAIDKADRVLWFEPSLETREAIRLFFPTVGDGLKPTSPAEMDAHDLNQTVPPTARAFLEAAALDGYEVDDDDDPPFTAAQESPPDPEIDIGSTPGIMSARLVERFGSSSEQLHALLAALRRDSSAWRWHLFPAYARWAFSRSLYNHGIAAQAVELFAAPLAARASRYPSARRSHHLAKVRPSPPHWPLARVSRHWQSGRCATGVVETAPPSRATTTTGRTLAGRAATRGSRGPCRGRRPGLANALDPERLAGALLESGAAAIYQGRFDTALRRAFELQYRRGRYAIRRWQSWGGWLEAMTHCHLHDPQGPRRLFLEPPTASTTKGTRAALADLDTVGLLAERVRRAIDGAHMVDTPQVTSRIRTPRQQDDLDLVLGDLELASGSAVGVPRARQHYEAVAEKPSCPVAAAWASLGLAEVTHREGRTTEASEKFEAVIALAKARVAPPGSRPKPCSDSTSRHPNAPWLHGRTCDRGCPTHPTTSIIWPSAILGCCGRSPSERTAPR